ncbi:hypothetical protein EVG59_04315 [Salmonella enterica subsp. enterica serovar Dortmund]|nr:hypothetical protein [Salmonella enterica subsp. enterica serovar Dortmund]ECB1958497.1 hypothetical protein [Salmonella enterica subsp. enterica serovar Dortmund]
MTDSDGEIVWETGYQVWGNTIQEKDHGGVEQNLRYQGQYLDRETGLHYNIHRYFDPDVGRFTTTDPISIAGGLNLYQYAPNPLGWIDPLGLATVMGKTAGGMDRETSAWRDRYGPASMRDHHLIPQALMNDKAFIAQMEKAGILKPTDYIHRQISRIPSAQHSAVHDAGWNDQWKAWFTQNPDFSKSDLQRNIKNMMKEHKIAASSRNFNKRYGCK